MEWKISQKVGFSAECYEKVARIILQIEVKGHLKFEWAFQQNLEIHLGTVSQNIVENQGNKCLGTTINRLRAKIAQIRWFLGITAYRILQWWWVYP